MNSRAHFKMKGYIPSCLPKSGAISAILNWPLNKAGANSAVLAMLVAGCASLTHDELPDDVIDELVELVRATIEDRDPELA